MNTEAGKGRLVLWYTETLPNTVIAFIYNIYKNACHSEGNNVLVQQNCVLLKTINIFEEEKGLTPI